MSDLIKQNDDDDTELDLTEGDDTGTPTNTFKAITSQEDFDKAVNRRLNRERKKYEGFEDFKAKAEQFDQLEAERGSELEKANRRAEKAEQELAGLKDKLSKAERNELVRDIADELGLPKKLAKRVQGATEDEIRADIEDLLEGLPKAEKNTEDKDDTKSPPSRQPKQKMTFTATGDESDEGLELSADDILKDIGRGGGSA